MYVLPVDSWQIPPAVLSQLCVPSVQGCGVGAGVGSGVGAGVGSGVGAGVGSGVGNAVGAEVGDKVGAAVGAEVGDKVGAAVGAAVGAGVLVHTRSVVLVPSVITVWPLGHKLQYIHSDGSDCK